MRIQTLLALIILAVGVPLAAMLIHLMRGKRPMSEFARALETSWPSAQRLENPKHWPSLRRLEKAASALGKRLVLSLE